MNWRRPLVALTLLVHVAFGLVVGMRAAGWLSFLELAAYDVLLQPAQAPGVTATGTPAPEVVVVAYTEIDEARYGYPLPDRQLAGLLERLAAADPAAIGLDLIRDRPEPTTADPADHRRVAAALTAHPTIVGILKETAPGFGPPPALADRPEQLAAADVVKDRDGRVRRGLLFLTPSTVTRPSLALQLAARWLLTIGVAPVWHGDQLRLGAAAYRRLDPARSGFYRPAADAGGYQFLSSYPACGEGFRRIPVHEILEAGLDGDRIAGRIVLIGNTVRAAKDRFEVPIECAGTLAGEMLGVEVHAHMVTQLIRQATEVSRPIETSVQRFGGAKLGRLIDGSWAWFWAVAGGAAALLLGSPVGLAVAVIIAIALIVGLAFGALVWLGWWLPVVPPLLGFALATGFAITYLMTRARDERQQVLTLFEGMVSKPLAAVILRRQASHAGANLPPPEARIATVMFSDIRGFTTISEALPEAELVTWLNEYMDAMVAIVEHHHGVVERFAGDGLTVAFGLTAQHPTPAAIAADARSAVDSARAMAARLPELNRLWTARGLPPIGIRIGIHTGSLMAGAVGGVDRWQYTVIGDTANTAARLESYGKDNPELRCYVGDCRILISAATHDHLPAGYQASLVGALDLKGKAEPVTVYRVHGDADPAPAVTGGRDDDDHRHEWD